LEVGIVSTAPQTLSELQDFLESVTGLPAISLGIVGDTNHRRGYHLGRDRIFGPQGDGERDYSVKTRRDKRGLSDSASAMDIGSFKGLRRMSKWIVREARKNAPDTRDIREVIYSPDGVRVLRWDRENGVDSEPHEGEADDSHLTHTHISWYRDREKRDKTALFKRFFDAPEAALQPARRRVIRSFRVPKVPTVCTVPEGTELFTASNLVKVAFVVEPGRDMPFVGTADRGVAIVHRTDEQGAPTGKALFARRSDLKNIRPAAPGP
jgi:hypothetical protein